MRFMILVKADENSAGEEPAVMTAADVTATHVRRTVDADWPSTTGEGAISERTP